MSRLGSPSGPDREAQTEVERPQPSRAQQHVEAFSREAGVCVRLSRMSRPAASARPPQLVRQRTRRSFQFGYANSAWAIAAQSCA